MLKNQQVQRALPLQQPDTPSSRNKTPATAGVFAFYSNQFTLTRFNLLCTGSRPLLFKVCRAVAR